MTDKSATQKPLKVDPELIAYWKTLNKSSNEYLAAELLESTLAELAACREELAEVTASANYARDRAVKAERELRLASPAEREGLHTVSDGFGSTWRCVKDRPQGKCGLQVVRPGKAQCDECDGPPSECASPAGPDALAEEIPTINPIARAFAETMKTGLLVTLTPTEQKQLSEEVHEHLELWRAARDYEKAAHKRTLETYTALRSRPEDRRRALEDDVIAAAVRLAPLLEAGWDEYDLDEDQRIGSQACDELVKAVKAMKAMLASGRSRPEDRRDAGWWAVWSHEHQGYWPASRCGYVQELRQAGHFTFDEACKIVRQGNYGMGTAPEETMMFVAAMSQQEKRDE